ncbi:MAG: ABC transporter substrate-binding protein [Lapillicoccus sp.]
MAIPTTGQPTARRTDDDELRIGILGPLEVRRGGSVLALGGRQQRAVLALLVVERGRPVTLDRVADALWADRLPQGYVATVQTYVFHLRAVLEPNRSKGAPGEVIVSLAGGGYRLDVPPDAVDADRFEEVARRGRVALEGGDPQQAAADLSAALGLWRGDVLSDLPELAVVEPVATRLGEVHLGAAEDWAAAELALGHHGTVLPELGALVEAHPLQERLSALRMLALYRSGRQADALAAYRNVQHLLDDELGVQPGQEVRTLHDRILRQDPALDYTTAAALPPYLRVPTAEAEDPTAVASPSPPGRFAWLDGWLRSRWVAVGAVIVVACGVVGGGVVWAARSRTVTPMPANSVGAVGPHGLVGDAVPLGALPGALVEAAGSVWVVNQTESTVSRVDPGSRRVVQTIPDVGQDPAAIAASGDDLWVAGLGSPVVTRISATANKVVDHITVGNQPAALVASAGAVWVADSGDNTIQRIDPKTDKADPPIPVGDAPSALALEGTTLWVANRGTATVSQIDTRTGERAAPDVAVDAGPAALALTSTDVWVANSLSQTVSRIDRSSGRVARIAVGDGPSSLVVADGRVWVCDAYAGSMSVIDPNANSVMTVSVRSSPRGLARVGDEVWATSAAFASTEHVGGTLTVAINEKLTTIDPASAYEPEIQQALTPVYDGLVTFGGGGGPVSSQVLVPDLATEIPHPVDGGKTYIFTIRQGIHYSDGRVVVASDFARGVRRSLFGVGGTPTALKSLVGAQACIDNPKAPTLCDLSHGAIADDATGRFTLHLTAPDPELVYKLAARVVPSPPSTPDDNVGRTPIPSTGPYQIHTFGADGSLTLVRNPNYTPWSVAAQPPGYPDVIRYRVETDDAAAVDAVLKGTADLTHSMTRFDLTATLPTRAHVSFIGNAQFVYLNSKLAPFDRKEVRQALNYAVDRRALVDLYPGGGAAATLSCQLLPPGFPGYRPYCPYQTGPADGPYLGPDLDKAKALVKESGTTQIPITIHRLVQPVYQAFPDYIATVLRDLGYTVTIEDLPPDVPDPLSPALAKDQIFTMWGFLPDYPSPATFYYAEASCSAPNANQFCDPEIDALAKTAYDLGVSDPTASLAAWTEVDRKVTDAAASLTLGNHKRVDVVSERVGNFQQRGGVGPDISQLWVK